MSTLDGPFSTGSHNSGARSASGWWQRLFQDVLDLAFPRFCRVCGAVAPEAGVLCAPCLGAVRWIDSACRRCGLPVLNAGPAGCAGCPGREFTVDRVVAAGVHEGPLRRLVLLHKYRGDREVLRFLGECLLGCWAQKLAPGPGDGPVNTSAARRLAVVPVPAHPLRAWLRQRRSVDELAREFGRRSGLEVRALLRRTRWTPSQTSLSRGCRLRGQVGSFRARGGRRALPSTVLLVDDVVTTGATVADAARALREIGVETVFVLAVARSR